MSDCTIVRNTLHVPCPTRIGRTSVSDVVFFNCDVMLLAFTMLSSFTGGRSTAMNVNSTIEDLPCGSWTTAALTDDAGRPFAFHEKLKSEYDFAPDECLAFCASNPDCTAFTVYYSNLTRCEWTDVSQDSLRVLWPAYDHEEEHEHDYKHAEQEVGHEGHEEHEYDHKQSSGLDYHDYDDDDFGFSMVMCANGAVQDYPKIFGACCFAAVCHEAV